ncbi:ATP-binding protein [Candidatus Pacearchaeota archaeon]|nr:ATP-binding protein [Candidatus Pacearchaeota archaeon]
MNETYEVIPSAKRLIKSLRDIGYDFSTAVADLIDNSIEAGASKVDIDVAFYGNDSYVRISDNGNGMKSENLKEAMRYGSERDYLEEDLGRFGLGLKTASMSQCQYFSVASRSKENKQIAVFSWDLSHIERTNKWEILQPKEKDIPELLKTPISEHSGTVVLWEKLDRIIGFKNSEGEAARNKVISMCRELENYLSMVFHKFLSNEVLGKSLEIYLNRNKIQPWDPFGRHESKTNILSPIKIKIIHNGAENKIFLQPYILPTKEEFSSQDSFQKLSGISGWNPQQGFYIYRANRMIQSGGWCGLRVIDEHTKLARIELNFSPALDDLFKINVAKMKVQLPVQAREEIERVVKPIVSLARERYDHEKKNLFKPSAPKVTEIQQTSPINKNILIKNSSQDIKFDLFTLNEVEQKVKEFATKYESKTISDVFSRLRRRLFGR